MQRVMVQLSMLVLLMVVMMVMMMMMVRMMMATTLTARKLMQQAHRYSSTDEAWLGGSRSKPCTLNLLERSLNQKTSWDSGCIATGIRVSRSRGSAAMFRCQILQQ